MSRGDLIALLGGLLCVSLLVVEFKLKSNALARRGKPRWHAIFGFPAILEILLSKGIRRHSESGRQTDLPESQVSQSAPSGPEDRPLEVEPKPPDTR